MAPPGRKGAVMSFRHYSPRLFKEFVAPERLGSSFKPRGALWLSCGRAWMEWIENEMPAWRRRYRHEYVFRVDTSQLLRIETSQDIQEFGKRFGIRNDDRPGSPAMYSIDWDKVRREAKDCCGIFVKDAHVMPERLDPNYLWYSTFDVCSVALWSLDCVRSVKRNRM